MKIIYTAGIVLLTLTVAACGAMKYQMINADMSLVSLGMNKEQVYEKIGKPNNVIASQRLEEGDLEILEYMRVEHNSYTNKNIQRPIWLYFLNNQLMEWGPGEDWQVNQALKERAIERYRNRLQNKE